MPVRSPESRPELGLHHNPEAAEEPKKRVVLMTGYGGSHSLAEPLVETLRQRDDVESVVHFPLHQSLNDRYHDEIREEMFGSHTIVHSYGGVALNRLVYPYGPKGCYEPVGAQQIDAVLPIEKSTVPALLKGFGCLNVHELDQARRGVDRAANLKLVGGKLLYMAQHPITHLGSKNFNPAVARTETHKTLLAIHKAEPETTVRQHILSPGSDQFGFDISTDRAMVLRKQGLDVQFFDFLPKEPDHEYILRQPEEMSSHIYGPDPATPA